MCSLAYLGEGFKLNTSINNAASMFCLPKKNYATVNVFRRNEEEAGLIKVENLKKTWKFYARRIFKVDFYAKDDGGSEMVCILLSRCILFANLKPAHLSRTNVYLRSSFKARNTSRIWIKMLLVCSLQSSGWRGSIGGDGSDGIGAGDFDSLGLRWVWHYMVYKMLLLTRNLAALKIFKALEVLKSLSFKFLVFHAINVPLRQCIP